MPMPGAVGVAGLEGACDYRVWLCKRTQPWMLVRCSGAPRPVVVHQPPVALWEVRRGEPACPAWRGAEYPDPWVAIMRRCTGMKSFIDRNADADSAQPQQHWPGPDYRGPKGVWNSHLRRWG